MQIGVDYKFDFAQNDKPKWVFSKFGKERLCDKMEVSIRLKWF